jgi:hypothetical protein
MDIRTCLLHLAVTLLRRGHIEEAHEIRRVSHYVPEEGGDVPSSFRHNYDYGESLFHGNMSKKLPVARRLKQHTGKGPRWSEKKAAALSSEILELIEQNPHLSGGEIYKQWQRQHPEASFPQQVDIRQQLIEYDEEKTAAEKRQQEEEGLSWEEWGEKLSNERTFLAEMPENFNIFPPGFLETTFTTPKGRGTTEPFWGKGDHILKSRSMIDEIQQHNLAVVPVPGWPEGYVAMEYNDRGVPSVVLYNVMPLRRGAETEQVGRGNALYVVPQYIGQEHWTKFLEARPREEVAKIIQQKKEENEPGWQRYNRGSFEQIRLLEQVLNYSKGR